MVRFALRHSLCRRLCASRPALLPLSLSNPLFGCAAARSAIASHRPPGGAPLSLSANGDRPFRSMPVSHGRGHRLNSVGRGVYPREFAKDSCLSIDLFPGALVRQDYGVIPVRSESRFDFPGTGGDGRYGVSRHLYKIHAAGLRHDSNLRQHLVLLFQLRHLR